MTNTTRYHLYQERVRPVNPGFSSRMLWRCRKIFVYVCLSSMRSRTYPWDSINEYSGVPWPVVDLWIVDRTGARIILKAS